MKVKIIEMIRLKERCMSCAVREDLFRIMLRYMTQ